MTTKDPALLTLCEDYLTIQSPYNARFVADLKEEVPPEERMWDPDQKVWEVSADLYDTAMEVASRYYNVKVEICNG